VATDQAGRVRDVRRSVEVLISCNELSGLVVRLI
jgi:hypothetical protein